MSMLLSLYGWTILAGALTAVALAWIGSQLAGRGQSVQALVISQGSSLGALVGLALLDFIHPDHGHGELSLFSLPLIGSLVSGALSALACERIIKSHWPSRNTYYVALFATLLSCGYLATALVPSLESHMASQFFGDLAVISERIAIASSVAAIIVLTLLALFWREITESSFDIATFGRVLPGHSREQTNRLFVIVALITICLSIQFMGLLFTLSALFLVPVLLSGNGRNARSLKSYTISTALIAVLGTTIGFVFSLWQGRLPTVPTIVLSYLVIGSLWNADAKMFRFNADS